MRKIDGASVASVYTISESAIATPEALDKSLDKNLSATDALLTFVEKLLAAMTEHPLSPTIFMLESIHGGASTLANWKRLSPIAGLKPC